MHYFALVNEGQSVNIRRLYVNQALQQSLKTLFEEQQSGFIPQGVDTIPFDPSYNVDQSEVFTIANFSLPQSYIDAVRTPRSISQLEMTAESPPRIKSIFAGTYEPSNGSVTLLFQAFNRSRLLVTGFTILHQGNTFQRLTDPGLTLDTKLVAVFKDGTLYFHSYKAVNPIVDISQYFAEATDGEIEQVLEHSRLYVEDKESVLKLTDGWMRRRYTAVLASGVLDAVPPRKIVNKAGRFGISLGTRRVNDSDALVFPKEKKEIKNLLTFLNEGFFEGELTGKLFTTNSQRAVTPPA